MTNRFRNSNGTFAINSPVKNTASTSSLSNSGIAIFNGQYFDVWQTEMTLCLSVESLWPLDGIHNAKDEQRALRILYSSISREILSAIGAPIKPTELWQALQRRYSRDKSEYSQFAIIQYATF